MKEGHAFLGMNLAAHDRARSLTALVPPLPVDAFSGLQAIDEAIALGSSQPSTVAGDCSTGPPDSTLPEPGQQGGCSIGRWLPVGHRKYMVDRAFRTFPPWTMARADRSAFT